MIIEFFRRGLKKEDMSETKQMLFARNLICACVESDNNADYQGLIYHQYADDPIALMSGISHSVALRLELSRKAPETTSVTRKRSSLTSFPSKLFQRPTAFEMYRTRRASLEPLLFRSFTDRMPPGRDMSSIRKRMKRWILSVHLNL